MTRTSPPEYRLILSPKAAEDIENILRFTGEQWGVKQWGVKQIAIYRDELTGALETILSNPASGHTSSDLPETHRLFPVGSHIIVYRVQEHVIGVIRILHKRMRLPVHVRGGSNATLSGERNEALTFGCARFETIDIAAASLWIRSVPREPLPDMGSLPDPASNTRVQALKWHIDDLLVTCGAPPDE